MVGYGVVGVKEGALGLNSVTYFIAANGLLADADTAKGFVLYAVLEAAVVLFVVEFCCGVTELVV